MTKHLESSAAARILRGALVAADSDNRAVLEAAIDQIDALLPKLGVQEFKEAPPSGGRRQAAL